MEDALEAGEWNDAKALILLTRGVSQRTLQIVKAGDREFTIRPLSLLVGVDLHRMKGIQ